MSLGISREEIAELLLRLEAMYSHRPDGYQLVNPDRPDAAKVILELMASPDVWEAMRQQGQVEGIAAAVQWLRDRSAMKPPAVLWHAASILADQLEQSRRPMQADPPQVTVEEDRA